MRAAVLADVHGNLPALTTVLAAVRSAGVDRYVVAGDLVGYGPFPNECIEMVAALNPLCAVAGNHDLMALGRLGTERCIPLARRSIEWTRTVLRPDSVRFLEELPLRAEVGSLVVAHGSLDDPEAYTIAAGAALQLVEIEERFPAAAVLVLGHTHRQLLCPIGGPAMRPGTSRHRLEPRPVLVNPGAVGQSREIRVRARFAVVDLDRGEVEFHAVRYDARPLRVRARAVGLAPRSYHLRPKPTRRLRTTGRRIARRIRHEA